MARKLNSMPRKTTRQQRLASPTLCLARQQDNNGSQAQLHASQDNKTTTARKPKANSSKTAKDSSPWLTSPTNASQGSTPLKTRRSQTQRLASQKRLISMAHEPTMHASQGKIIRKCNGSQAQTSRIFMGRNPPMLHSRQTVPLFSLQCAQVVVLYHTQKGGVLGIPVCILSRPIPNPMACAGSSQCHTAFKEFQALSLSSSFPIPWLLPDPGSFAFPSLSQSLALMDPPVLCYLPWAVRLTAGGAGGMEDGRRCGLRLPSAGCIAACKSSVSQCPPMSQVAYAEGR